MPMLAAACQANQEQISDRESNTPRLPADWSLTKTTFPGQAFFRFVLEVDEDGVVRADPGELVDQAGSGMLVVGEIQCLNVY